MKRVGNLIEQIAGFNNLLMAYKNAAKGKRNRNYVKRFYFRLEENLLEIQEQLLSGTYSWGTYNVFEITDNKKRLIHAPQFRDRVTQHAICAVIEPIFDRTFIDTSFACRKDKGTLAGVIAYEKAIKDKSLKYALKCDIKKYFNSIDHEILFKLIERKIKDKTLLIILRNLIFTDDRQGIAIGNLCSQLFANLYLNQLDVFVKCELKAKHYFRYMDDFVILDNSKEHLQQLRTAISVFLKQELHLTLHPNKQHILLAKNGVNWLGYNVYPENYKRVAERNVLRFRKRLKQLNSKYMSNKITLSQAQQVLASWFALAKHANTFNLSKQLFSENFLHSDIASLARYMMCKQMNVTHSKPGTKNTFNV
jgi:retron-type reverse transcriptase